jgi:hypothetical protein
MQNDTLIAVNVVFFLNNEEFSIKNNWEQLADLFFVGPFRIMYS